MTKSNTATRSPAVPSSKVSKITDAKPKAVAQSTTSEPSAKKVNPNRITSAKMVRVLGASSKRTARLASFFDPTSDLAKALRDAAALIETTRHDATLLPADWKPIRSQTARAFASLVQGGKCRIAKGLVDKYFVLLDDEDGDTVEEKTAALNELLIHKLGEKNSVVRTANSTRFAINTRHLRTI